MREKESTLDENLRNKMTMATRHGGVWTTEIQTHFGTEYVGGVTMQQARYRDTVWAISRVLACIRGETVHINQSWSVAQRIETVLLGQNVMYSQLYYILKQ